MPPRFKLARRLIRALAKVYPQRTRRELIVFVMGAKEYPIYGKGLPVVIIGSILEPRHYSEILAMAASCLVKG